MSKSRSVVTQYLIHYGLSQEQHSILENCLPGNTMLHDATECATDIIALCPTLGVVINPAVMPQADLEMILDYYNEVRWGLSEFVIFTKMISVPRISKISCMDEGDLTPAKLNRLLAQADSRNRRSAGYHARLVLCLTILKKIRNSPGISTKKLAEECEVSEKSILRYIETLRVSGEWVEYDRLLRGWNLHPAFNSFFE